MLILKEKNSGLIIGKYKGMCEAGKIFTAAKTHLTTKKAPDSKLLLLDGEHIIMTIELEQLNSELATA